MSTFIHFIITARTADIFLNLGHPFGQCGKKTQRLSLSFEGLKKDFFFMSGLNTYFVKPSVITLLLLFHVPHECCFKPERRGRVLLTDDRDAAFTERERATCAFQFRA